MHVIKQSLPIVANAYGESLGVRVVVGGNNSYTDGKVIYVPSVNADTIPALWGFLAHEAAHVRFTDFEQSKKCCKSHIEHSLHNILEDIRIEKLMPMSFPGIVKDLEQACQYMLDKQLFGMPKKESKPIEIAMMYLLFFGRVNVLEQQMLDEHLKAWAERLESTFTSSIVNELNAAAKEMADLVTNDDVFELVAKILAILSQNQNSQNQSQQGGGQGEGQGQNQDQQGQGDGNGDGEEQGQGDGSNQSQGNGNDASQNQSQGDAQDQGNGDSDSDSDGDSQGDGNQGSGNQGDSQDAQSQGDGQSQGNSGGSGSAKCNGIDLDNVEESDVPKCQCAKLREQLAEDAIDTPSTYKLGSRAALNYSPDALATGRALANRVKQALQPVLQDKANVVKSRKVAGRKLHRQMYRLALGDPRVFMQKTAREAPNAAIHVVLDMSGSMQSLVNNHMRRWACAGASALALYLAVKDAKNVDFSCAGFSGSKITEVDTRHEKNFFMQPDNSTPTELALQHGLTRLAASKKPRKVMILITDGEPDSYSSYLDTAKKIEASTVELIGISLDDVGLNLKNEAIIQSLEELPQALTKVVLSALS